jgi:hypothetical protein
MMRCFFLSKGTSYMNSPCFPKERNGKKYTTKAVEFWICRILFLRNFPSVTNHKFWIPRRANGIRQSSRFGVQMSLVFLWVPALRVTWFAGMECASSQITCSVVTFWNVFFFLSDSNNVIIISPITYSFPCSQGKKSVSRIGYNL